MEGRGGGRQSHDDRGTSIFVGGGGAFLCDVCMSPTCPFFPARFIFCESKLLKKC